MSRSSNEYTPVIVEIGSRFIKVGFAGETSPLVVKSTGALFPFNEVNQTYPSFLGVNDSSLTTQQRDVLIERSIQDNPHISKTIELYNNNKHKWIRLNSESNKHDNITLYNKLHEIFSIDLMVSPRRCKIILIDNKFSIANKFKIFDALINKLKVKSVITLPDQVLSTIGGGERDGLVLDFGWEALKIDPIFDLRSLTNGGREVFNDFNGVSLHYRVILELLQLNDPNVNELIQRSDLFEVIETFIMKDMYVGEGLNEDEVATILGVPVPSHLRHSIVELMLKDPKLYNIVDHIVKSSNIDCRPILLKSFLITGGLSKIPGFKARLMEELKKRYPSASSKNTLGSWAGSSLYITTVLIKQDKSKWKELEITREILGGLISDKSYKLSVLPDSINASFKRA